MGVARFALQALPAVPPRVVYRDLRGGRRAMVDPAQLDAARPKHDVGSNIGLHLETNLGVVWPVERHGDGCPFVAVERSGIEVGDDGALFARLEQRPFNLRAGTPAARP